VNTQPAEPPCTVPYARWCGRGGAARLPPIPIHRVQSRSSEIRSNHRRADDSGVDGWCVS
jgi:hypothetical protein